MEIDQLPDPLLLSKHLASALSEWDEYAPVPENDEQREYVEEICQDAQSLEGFKAPPHPQGSLTPDLQDWFLKKAADEFYCRDVVSNLPGMVERFSRLAPVLVGRLPDKQVTIYLREATGCFVYGFFQGSVALSRSALESGLSRHFERKLGHVSPMELKEKIEKAHQFKFISGGAEQLAEKVRKSANQVIHSKPATEALAFDVLVAVRGALAELFES